MIVRCVTCKYELEATRERVRRVRGGMAASVECPMCTDITMVNVRATACLNFVGDYRSPLDDVPLSQRAEEIRRRAAKRPNLWGSE